MEKKTILMVHNFYQIAGGEDTVFENEKKLLIEQGHRVYTYTRTNDELKTHPWKKLLLPFTTVWSFKSYFEVRRLIREKGIDIVHCHNTFPLVSPSVYYAARSRKVPVVQTIHNFRLLCPNGLFYRDGRICEDCLTANRFLPALKGGCYRSSRLQTAVLAAMLLIHRRLGTYRKISYIFLTDFNRKKFDKLLDIQGSNIFVKPNFTEKPAAAPPQETVRPVFVFSGRLDESKGILFLLKVWPTLPKEWQLHIYGDGPCREACRQAAAECGNIHVFGFRPREEIFGDLAGAAAMLFPSRWYEGYPMVLSECFSLGRTVVSTNIGNQGDIVIASGGGVTFDIDDETGFRAALEKVLQNNAVYSANATAYYEQNLTRQRNYELLEKIYNSVKHISNTR